MPPPDAVTIRRQDVGGVRGAERGYFIGAANTGSTPVPALAVGWSSGQDGGQ